MLSRFLKKNGQLEKFIETFGLPKWPNDKYKIDEDMGAMSGEEKYVAVAASVSSENKDFWKNLGLIREENGKLVVDGLIPALSLARTAALMA